MKRIEIVMQDSGSITVGLPVNAKEVPELESPVTVKSLDAALAVVRDLAEDGDQEFDAGFSGKVDEIEGKPKAKNKADADAFRKQKPPQKAISGKAGE